MVSNEFLLAELKHGRAPAELGWFDKVHGHHLRVCNSTFGSICLPATPAPPHEEESLGCCSGPFLVWHVPVTGLLSVCWLLRPCAGAAFQGAGTVLAVAAEPADVQTSMSIGVGSFARPGNSSACRLG